LSLKRVLAGLGAAIMALVATPTPSSNDFDFLLRQLLQQSICRVSVAEYLEAPATKSAAPMNCRVLPPPRIGLPWLNGAAPTPIDRAPPKEIDTYEDAESAPRPTGPLDTVELEYELGRSRTEAEKLHRAQVLQINALMKTVHDDQWCAFVRLQRDEAQANGARIAARLGELMPRWREEGDCVFAIQAAPPPVVGCPSQPLACPFRLARLSDVVRVQRVVKRTSIMGTTFEAAELAIIVRCVLERAMPTATPATTATETGQAVTSTAIAATAAAMAFEEVHAPAAAAFTAEDMGRGFVIDEGSVTVERVEREVEWGPRHPAPRLRGYWIHAVEPGGIKGHVSYMCEQGKVQGKFRNPPILSGFSLRAADVRALGLHLHDFPPSSKDRLSSQPSSLKQTLGSGASAVMGGALKRARPTQRQSTGASAGGSGGPAHQQRPMQRRLHWLEAEACDEVGRMCVCVRWAEDDIGAGRVGRMSEMEV
jgi:hypothetical protein